jgi:predicted Rossmann fold nucleotide-binding protein DprA/Smf involved in DNA uptake
MPMDVRDYLSDDGQAVLALCSNFALAEDGPSALTLSEWNELETQIAQSSLGGPAALQGLGAERLANELGIGEGEAERVAALLERAGRLAMELEGVFSRGMWAVTRVDAGYPELLRQTLKHQAPAVLFGSGDRALLNQPAVAVVGSRHIDEAGSAFARRVGQRCVEAGLAVVSGGARGTDRLAMDGALSAEGKAIGVLADSLEATIRKADVRELVLDGRLVLVTPYAPTAGFSVGGAMGRNKVIYGLSEFAVVVSSDVNSGGTWAGAAEALKGHWCPVFVREGPGVPEGNRALLKKGALPITDAQLAEEEDFREWLRKQKQARGKASPGASAENSKQQDLFG